MRPPPARPALCADAPGNRKEALSFLKREGLGHFQAMIRPSTYSRSGRHAIDRFAPLRCGTLHLRAEPPAGSLAPFRDIHSASQKLPFAQRLESDCGLTGSLLF